MLIVNEFIIDHHICDALRDLVPFVQFKKREKHPRRSVNFSKVTGFKPATLLKLTLLHGVAGLKTATLLKLTLLHAGNNPEEVSVR